MNFRVVVPWYPTWRLNFLKFVVFNFSSCCTAIAPCRTISDSVEIKFHFLLLFHYPLTVQQEEMKFDLNTARCCHFKGSWRDNMLRNWEQQISGCWAVRPNMTVTTSWFLFECAECQWNTTATTTTITATTGKPQFNESEGTNNFVLYNRDFVITGDFYYSINYRETWN